jgi:hypothetical protein
LILEVPKMAELAKGKSYKHVRLPELKRGYMFGTIWRDLKKTLKQSTLSDCNLVIQILDKEE